MFGRKDNHTTAEEALERRSGANEDPATCWEQSPAVKALSAEVTQIWAVAAPGASDLGPRSLGLDVGNAGREQHLPHRVQENQTSDTRNVLRKFSVRTMSAQ